MTIDRDVELLAFDAMFARFERRIIRCNVASILFAIAAAAAIAHFG